MTKATPPRLETRTTSPTPETDNLDATEFGLLCLIGFLIGFTATLMILSVVHGSVR